MFFRFQGIKKILLRLFDTADDFNNHVDLRVIDHIIDFCRQHFFRQVCVSFFINIFNQHFFDRHRTADLVHKLILMILYNFDDSASHGSQS